MPGEIDNLQIKIAADSQSASENVLALARSLESLSAAAIKATNPLAEFSKALGGLKGFRTTNISKSADDIANAFGKIGKIGSIESSVELLDSVENLNEAVSGLRDVSESIKGLKVNKSFETNLDALSDALKKLNQIGDTSAFASGVTSVEDAIGRLNNIEVGQGFINLVQASTQWADALDRMNGVRLGADFAQGISRVARACEILNEVDFSGFKRMNDVLGQLPDNVRVSFGASSEEVKQLTDNLSRLQSTVSSIQNAMPQRRQRDSEKSADMSAEKPDYSWSNEEIKGTLERAQAYDKEVSQIRKVLAAYETLGEEVPENVLKAAESLVVLQNEMESVESNSGSFRDRLKEISHAVTSGAFKVFGAEVKAVMSPLTAIGNKFKKLSEKAGQFFASIKRIALYRAIRSILKSITEGFEEGRKNLYYYSQAVGTDFAPSMDKAATAALYLKNSIGAATAPLTNFLVPMIDKAVDSIVVLINKFNELTAVLTGASTWTKAVKYPTTWQESLDDANKSAKKLKSTMLGFDELNVIEFVEPASKKSVLDAEDYIKMFEEVKTDMSISNRIPELLMPIKLAWDSQGDKTLQTIKDTWNEILALIGAVGESVRKVWTNGTGQKSLELILQIVQNIVGTFGELAKGIRKAWEENETGTRIIQATWNVANNLLTVFRDIWGAIREWASGLDWSPLLTSLASLGEAVERLTDPDGALARLAKSAFEKVLLPIGKWLIEQGLPAAVDLLTAAFDALGVALEFLEPLFQKTIDFLGKIAGFTFNNISGLASGFSALVEGLSGKEIDGAKGQRAEEANKKLIESLGGEDSWYGELNKKLIDFGSHGMHDFLNIDLPNAGAWWSEVLNGTEDQKGIFGQIGDLIKGEFENNDVEIISDSSMAAFDNDVLSITGGYKDIKKAAADANKVTNETKPASGLAGAFESLKTSYNDFAAAWGEGVDGMKYGWDNFVNGIQTEWQTFKDDWANGMTAVSSSVSGAWESIKTFFSDGWDSIKGGVTTFGADWSNGWDAMKQSVSDLWTNAKTDFETGWSAIQGGVDDFKKSFATGLSTIKKTVTDTWSKVTTTLSSKWDDFKGFVNDYKSNWKSGFDTITNHVSESWEKIKGKIGDTINWNNLKEHVSDYAGHWFDKFREIRQTVFDIMKKIHDEISDKVSTVADMIRNSAIVKAVSDIADTIKDTVSKIWGDDTSGIRGTFVKIANGLYDFITQIFDGWHLGALGDKMAGVLNGLIDNFETAINYIIRGLNFFIEKANEALDIHIEIPTFVPMIGGSTFEGVKLPDIPEVIFPKFANGGFPDEGSLFLANEPGNPEMVGKIGNHTAVANNDQIVSAVSKGVYDAMISAMSQNRGESGKTELHVYLDRQEITSQIEQQQRDNGVSIMSGLVYT